MAEPQLEEFMTYEGKCASCRHQGGFSGWCFRLGRVVKDEETCMLYEGGRAE